MSSTVLRAQCIQVTIGNTACRCPWFVASASPLQPAEQHICCRCGHALHAHADYVSTVVHQCPSTQCIAYVQKTPKSQLCTCETRLCDHIPVNNPFFSEDPWYLTGYLSDGVANGSYPVIYDDFSDVMGYHSAAGATLSTSNVLSSGGANIVQYPMPASTTPSTSLGVFNPFDLNATTTSDPTQAPVSILTPSPSPMIQSDAMYAEANMFNAPSAQHQTNGSYGNQLGSDVMKEHSNYQEYLEYISTLGA